MGDVTAAEFLAYTFHVGPKGRVSLPAAVRREAGVPEGAEVVARVAGPGRIVIETPEAIRERIWSAAPEPSGLDASADLRRMRNDDAALADAAAARRETATTTEDAGSKLLALLDIQ